MSLFNRALRPPPTWSDEAIERYLAAALAHVEPDPLFRRRLRSEVVNRYVAVREGMISPARVNVGGRVMGRLGRATLYASFALAATSASVLAASQEALPGDVLYDLKLRVEQLRVDMLPAQLHDELAANALLERADEMSRLAARGDLAAAIALAPVVEQAYAELEALAAVEGEAAAARIEQHLVAVAHVVESLPAAARVAVVEAFAAYPGVVSAISSSQADTGGENNTGASSNGSTNSGGDNNIGPGGGGHEGGSATVPAAAPDAGDTDEPLPMPEPTATPAPTSSPEPAESADPEPSPTANLGNSGNGSKVKESQSDAQSDEDED
jgi:hypothetical protein